MAEVMVIYKTPKDPAAFDKYHAETNIPLAKNSKMTGVSCRRRAWENE
jgi:hypothetical protein